MRPPVRPGFWVGIVLLAVSVRTETEVYGKLGGEVFLKPDTKDSLFSITWKKGNNLAIEWEGGNIIPHRHFQERGHLNTSTGIMTISGLTNEDSGQYTPEVNNVEGAAQRLIVIIEVPVPTVSTSCQLDTCVLTCDGQTDGAGPVKVMWMSDNNVLPVPSDTKRIIKKEESSDVKEFSCELQNPVSRERSKSIPNPFTTSGPRISTGIIVFVCLVVLLGLVVVFHRVKAGAWFFDQESMPWEADFWRRSQAPREDAESNGNTPHQPTPDEGTPMTSD